MSEKHNSLEAIKALFEISIEEQEIAFIYIGYAGIILRLLKCVIAFDLGKSLSKEAAEAIPTLDLLFYTHTHWDHYHAPNANRILKNTSSHIIAEPQVAEDLGSRIPHKYLITANPTSPVTIKGYKVIPVVGVHPRPITLFKVTYKTTSIFHGGDSGYVLVKNQSVDMAFLPVGTPSPSCTPKTALQFSQDLTPKVAVAMHGNSKQMKLFKELVNETLPGVRIIIPELFTPIRVNLEAEQ